MDYSFLQDKKKFVVKDLFKGGRVFIWGGVIILLLMVFTPPIPLAGSHAQWSGVAARGKDVYIAITGANSARKPLGLPPLWPKTYLAYTNHLDDVSAKIFKTSSDYFYELYDGSNAGTDQHDPYVRGYDYSKLAGAGVAAKYGQGKLTSANNMWVIAANITEEDADIIPVLITRNVDVREIERAINCGIKTNDFKAMIPLGKGDYKTPFGKKGFVCVRKSGGTYNNPSRYATLGDLFDNKELPPRDPSKPPIVYLMP
jgi:hypothetical protein